MVWARWMGAASLCNGGQRAQCLGRKGSGEAHDKLPLCDPKLGIENTYPGRPLLRPTRPELEPTRGDVTLKCWLEESGQ
jgi:hypothetical protein